jgi:hypothetical protein
VVVVVTISRDSFLIVKSAMSVIEAVDRLAWGAPLAKIEATVEPGGKAGHRVGIAKDLTRNNGVREVASWV